MLETLESRRLLSSTLSPDGVLTVTGTDGSDHIRVMPQLVTHHHHQHKPHHQIVVLENHSAQTFAADQVTRIVVNGGAGHDSIAVGHLSKPAELNGGEGNDYLLGGDSDDLLSGGAGSDSLYGGSGNDTLDGGAGRDRLFGGSGDDTLLAQDGEIDYVNGGSGDDRASVDRRGSDGHDGHRQHRGDLVFHVETILDGDKG